MPLRRRRHEDGLDASFTVRCTLAEKEHAQAWFHERGLTLSGGTRLFVTNATGFNDPMDLQPFHDTDFKQWNAPLVEEGRKRIRRVKPPGELTVVGALGCLGVCRHAAQHHHDWMQIVQGTVL